MHKTNLILVAAVIFSAPTGAHACRLNKSSAEKGQVLRALNKTPLSLTTVCNVQLERRIQGRAFRLSGQVTAKYVYENIDGKLEKRIRYQVLTVLRSGTLSFGTAEGMSMPFPSVTSASLSPASPNIDRELVQLVEDQGDLLQTDLTTARGVLTSAHESQTRPSEEATSAATK